MVNCGVLARAAALRRRARRRLPARRDLPVPVEGSETRVRPTTTWCRSLGGEAGDQTLPYLAVIRSKLPDIAIKLTPIESRSQTGRPNCHRHPAGQARQPLPARADLVVLARGRHAGADDERDHAALPERARAASAIRWRNLEIDPLRPLNNLLWGYVQDEQHRLTVVRAQLRVRPPLRAAAGRQGRASACSAADSRSKFLEAFHNLLHLCAVFFKQDDDTTVMADALPGAERAEGSAPDPVAGRAQPVRRPAVDGAHRDADAAVAAGAAGVPRVPADAHHGRLPRAVDGPRRRDEEAAGLDRHQRAALPQPRRSSASRSLLSIRYGDWSDVQEPLQAFNWARYWRPEIQGYIHAYRAVTGVDLAVETTDTKVDATLPSVLLQSRLATQQRTA